MMPDHPGAEKPIQRAVLHSSSGALTSHDLAAAVDQAVEGSSGADHRGNGGSAYRRLTLEQRLGEVERRIIEESLQRHNYHRIHTARELGVSRVTLYNKMKKYRMLT